jgi:hypothetical protein
MRVEIVVELARAENDAFGCLAVDGFIIEDRPEFAVGKVLDLGNAFPVAQQTLRAT